MPPLGLFFSKFYILYSLFLSGHYLLGIVIIVLLAGILIGILYHPYECCVIKLNESLSETCLSMRIRRFWQALLLGSVIIGAGIGEIPYLEKLLAQAVR